MRVAVASGKGGTGKTTVAVNLARVMNSPVQVLDCDVEEPNCHLLLKAGAGLQEIVGIPVPEVDPARCDGCGECSRFCAFHAIVALKDRALVFPELCHGCGGCRRVCPRGAIREIDRRIGVVETAQSGLTTLIQGRLDIGVATPVPLVRAVRARRRDGLPAILDAPPGTACPVVTTLRGTDAVLLVTEPTPFGLHDLQLLVAVVRELGLPFGVVVNRMGIGDARVQAWCAEAAIPLLPEIPNDRRIAEAGSRGELIVDALPEFRGVFVQLLERARAMCVSRKEVTCANL